MFNHVSFESDEFELKTVSEDGKRWYVTESGGKYPSITTVISYFSKNAIMAWRKRVGEEEANKVSLKASRRGTNVHLLCEDYINNLPVKKGVMPSDLEMFSIMKSVLDERVGDVYAQEYAMYSDHLGIAGRCDCIAMFDGKLSIIDFKTSKRPLSAFGGDKLDKYFRQAAGYAVMFEERTKIPVSQVVIIAAVDNEIHPEVHVSRRDDHIGGLIGMIDEYYTKNGMVGRQ
jgi:hypothetical protein